MNLKMIALTKVMRKEGPPQWILEVEGRDGDAVPVNLSANQLLKRQAVRCACLEQADIVMEMPSEADYQQRLGVLLEDVVVRPAQEKE